MPHSDINPLSSFTAVGLSMAMVTAVATLSGAPTTKPEMDRTLDNRTRPFSSKATPIS
jgi:hypothetical protein